MRYTFVLALAVVALLAAPAAAVASPAAAPSSATQPSASSSPAVQPSAAGVGAPDAAARSPIADGGPSAATDGGAAPDDCAAVADGEQRPDPDGDTVGWENGCWPDDPIAVDQTDGLTDAELSAVVSRTMARVEEIRGLEFTESVPVTVESRAALRERFENGSTNETERVFDNAKFEALFLVNETTDSIAVQRANLGASVLGFYDTDADEIVLVADSLENATIAETTLAHELVHALQDQHFNLSRPELSGQTRDAVNAIDGLVEGDASYVEHRYDARCTDRDHAWNGTCVRQPAGGSGSGGVANIGVYFVKFQPYSDGPAFVGHLVRDDGWAAVDDLYADPPASAEQVIHPEKLDSDAPTDVALEDATGEGWSRVVPPEWSPHGTVGQSGVAAMFAYPLYGPNGRPGRIVEPQDWLNYTGPNSVSSFDPLNYGFAAAGGWDGDRLHVYQNEAGETGYVWRLVFDGESDAAEFRAAYGQLLSYWGGEEVGADTYRIEDGGFADAFYVRTEGDTVTIVNAPTVEALTGVKTDADPSVGTPSPTGTPPPTASATPTGGGDPAASPATDETDSPTGTTTPGFGVAAAAAALGAAALAVRRRR